MTINWQEVQTGGITCPRVQNSSVQCRLELQEKLNGPENQLTETKIIE